jgi:hypothetical protein
MFGWLVIAIIVIAIIIVDCLMWVRALRVVRALSLTPDGTAFTGAGRHWQVQTFTGRVTSVNMYTTSSGTSEHTTSTTHQTLLLVDRAGGQHNATLSGVSAGIFAGQIVTHCWAASGHKQVTFAALNHSTRQQYVSKDGLNSIAKAIDVLVPVWAAVSFLSMVGIPQVIVFAVIFKRAIGAFERSGTSALWTATAPIAVMTPKI